MSFYLANAISKARKYASKSDNGHRFQQASLLRPSMRHLSILLIPVENVEESQSPFGKCLSKFVVILAYSFSWGGGREGKGGANTDGFASNDV